MLSSDYYNKPCHVTINMVQITHFFWCRPQNFCPLFWTYSAEEQRWHRRSHDRAFCFDRSSPCNLKYIVSTAKIAFYSLSFSNTHTNTRKHTHSFSCCHSRYSLNSQRAFRINLPGKGGVSFSFPQLWHHICTHSCKSHIKSSFF